MTHHKATPGPLFEIGQLVATPGALETFDLAYRVGCLCRHSTGDWGDVPAEDKRLNSRAVRDGSRILSAYKDRGETLWIITEADRSATTFLLPDEY